MSSYTDCNSIPQDICIYWLQFDTAILGDEVQEYYLARIKFESQQPLAPVPMALARKPHTPWDLQNSRFLLSYSVLEGAGNADVALYMCSPVSWINSFRISGKLPALKSRPTFKSKLNLPWADVKALRTFRSYVMISTV